MILGGFRPSCPEFPQSRTFFFLGKARGLALNLCATCEKTGMTGKGASYGPTLGTPQSGPAVTRILSGISRVKTAVVEIVRLGPAG